LDDDYQLMYQHINASDSEVDTPLMWAAEEGQIEAVQILLDYGVDINSKNKEGLTALHWAIRADHLDVLSFYWSTRISILMLIQDMR
jgi:ankyrin repeat protein